MFPGVLSAAPPGNQQIPVGQNCKDERELINSLNVLLGGGEMLFWESKRGEHLEVIFWPLFCSPLAYFL